MKNANDCCSEQPLDCIKTIAYLSPRVLRHVHGHGHKVSHLAVQQI